MQNLYTACDGLCLDHLGLAFQRYTRSHFRKAEFLNLDAQKRLNRWQQAMKGYDHKHRWENLHEPVLPEEEQAWRQVLAFVTGLEPSALTRPNPELEV